ncbi:type II secretion system F family protein, partial [Cellulomonas sp. 179-A 9B4 NHS]|uniref:type II secretion system F family protein n=1 Tax=Cellulomonas sp. 179-A 9B4 NHS TaxID=3142379 RepID=UPI00399FD39A
AGVVAGVVPPAPVLLALVERRRGRDSRRARVRVRPDDAAASRVHAVLAGARTAAELGAPLADVLEQLAAAVAADAEHAGEVAAALAGPRATARVLVLLPALGLLVGAALGARPWQVLAAGGPGTAAGVLGAVLVLAGRAWVGALLRSARAAGGTA